MLTYFSAVMSNDTGLNMVREASDWLRSMERPEGWAYAYTYDGREAYTGQYRDMLRTDYHTRTKVVLDCVDEVLNVAGTGGVAFISAPGPVGDPGRRSRWHSSRAAAP